MWKPILGKTTSNMLLVSHASKVMPYERPTLLKATKHTIRCDPVKGFPITLLEVSLVKGLYNIHLECHPVKRNLNSC